MSNPNNYDKANLIRVSGAFTNPIGGAALDPTTVLFSITSPAGIPTIYTYLIDSQLVRDSTGNYHVDVNANAVGTWRYRFYSTGVGQAAKEGAFMVNASDF